MNNRNASLGGPVVQASRHGSCWQSGLVSSVCSTRPVLRLPTCDTTPLQQQGSSSAASSQRDPHIYILESIPVYIGKPARSSEAGCEVY